MNTAQNRQGNRLEYFLSRPVLWRWLLQWACALPLAVAATTPAEREVDLAPMPHQTISAHGNPVKVHWVSSRGALFKPTVNATLLAQMHQEVEDCVREHNQAGLASRPPHEWPEYTDSERSDIYAAFNRTIHYSVVLSYRVSPFDCSLVEGRRSSAGLYSSLGQCDIDLGLKEARGRCDASGHANAKPWPQDPPLTLTQIAAIERQAASNPAMAAFAAAIHAHPPFPTGARKTIAGIECDVWESALDPGGTTCMSRGGSFAAQRYKGAPVQSGMALEITSRVKGATQAKQAQLDALVDGAVFAPYLAGGFRLIKPGTRP